MSAFGWKADLIIGGPRLLLMMRWTAPTTGIAMSKMRLLLMNHSKGSRP